MTIDQTRFDIPIPDLDPEGDHQPISLAPPRRSGRTRRTAAVVFAVVTALAVIVAANAGSNARSSSPTFDDPVALVVPDPDLDNDVEVGVGTGEDASEAEVADPDPVAPPAPEDAQQDQPADDPAPDPEPAGPCDLLPEGRILAVSPAVADLPVGQYASELLVTNCGNEAAQWSAHTLAGGVQLGEAGGVVAPGATVDVQYAVDPAVIVAAKYTFFITVTEAGFETDVMVTVSKAIVNPGLQNPNLGLLNDE